MSEPNKWLRDGNLIYTLESIGWRRGEEQFQNRISLNLWCSKSVSLEEREFTIKLVLAMDGMVAALKGIASTHENWCSGGLDRTRCRCKAGIAYAALPGGIE